MPASPMGQGLPVALMTPVNADELAADPSAGAAFLAILGRLPAVAAPVGPTVGPTATTPPSVALRPTVRAPDVVAVPVTPLDPVALPLEPAAVVAPPTVALDPTVPLPPLSGVAPLTSEAPGEPVLPALAEERPRSEPARYAATGLTDLPEPSPELLERLVDRFETPSGDPRAPFDDAEPAPRPLDPGKGRGPSAPASSAAAEGAPPGNGPLPSSATTEAGPPLPGGPEMLGLSEPEPLPGSVRLDGIRGARVTVPMDDGTTVRARVDVQDAVVDVALRASAETGLAAEQRVGELREALAQQGLSLGEFDVQADGQEADPKAQSDEPAQDSPERSALGSDDPDDHHEPRASYGAIDDQGRGGLLNRRI